MSEFDTLSGPGDPFATVSGGMGVDYAQMNKGVTPIFFVELLPDPAASELAGMAKMREFERVRIIVAGDALNQPVHPVDDNLRERFADQYARWKANKAERHIEGTRITEWLAITQLQAAEFHANGVFSVENLRDLSDAHVAKFADGRIWREKAGAWLETAKTGANDMRLAAENERMKEEIAELKRQFSELATRIPRDDEDAPRRGPGRPRAAA